MADFHEYPASIRDWPEERLRQELAYCRARLTDIDRAPPDSRHRQGRARILRQIREYEALIEAIQDKCDPQRRQQASLHRPRMMSH